MSQRRGSNTNKFKYSVYSEELKFSFSVFFEKKSTVGKIFAFRRVSRLQTEIFNIEKEFNSFNSIQLNPFLNSNISEQSLQNLKHQRSYNDRKGSFTENSL